MGNGSSSRRNGRNSQNPGGSGPLAPQVIPPPPGYPGNHALHPGSGSYASNGHVQPFYYPPNYNGPMGMGPQFYHTSGFTPTNGQSMMNQGYRHSPAMAPSTLQAPSPVTETQKANTIRNDVNVKKSSLRLEEDEENPGYHLVAFTFDATIAGSVTIFFLARAIEKCGFTPLSTELFKVTRVPFEKGLCQKFKQAPGTGVNLAMFDERDLCKEGDDDVYPLVVRTETISKDAPAGVSLQSGRIDGPLPEWVQCQTTQAVLEKKEDGNFNVRVVSQNILIDGTKYELKEIYGIEGRANGGTFDSGDDGKECVICMSEPRDTFVFPCRHMCMCKECADVLKSQTNRCPICRTPVEKLLQMKFNEIHNTDQLRSMELSSPSEKSSSVGAGQSSSTAGPALDEAANRKGSSTS